MLALLSHARCTLRAHAKFLPGELLDDCEREGLPRAESSSRMWQCTLRAHHRSALVESVDNCGREGHTASTDANLGHRRLRSGRGRALLTDVHLSVFR